MKNSALAPSALALLCLMSLHSTAGADPLANSKLHGDETIQTPIGDIKLIDSYFDDAASKRLYDEMDYQRASQAYIWSMPLVSMTTWRDNQGKAYGVTGDTDFVVLESLKEKRGIVTGNLTTPYIFNFINLKSGPVEIAYPPGQTAGGVLDFWQRPIFDLGLTGPDKGRGATYIVVGPENDPAKYKKDGVNVYQSVTNNVFIGLRSSTRIPHTSTSSPPRTRWVARAARWPPVASSRARTWSGAPRRRAAWATGKSSRMSSTTNPFVRSTRPGWP